MADVLKRRIVVAPILLLLLTAQVSAEPAGSAVLDDVKYLVDNVQLDVRDIVTLPLRLTSEDSVVRSSRFYLALAGVGALWGGSFALDQTLRSHLHTMSSSDADLLQNISYGSIGASAALLYGYGYWSGDARTRDTTLTGGEGAGIATLVNVGIKASFGRLRPHQDGHSHTAFFRGGASFASGDVTPMFGLAAGISETFDNEWYVAAPVYSLALLDGFGRMGHDAHWFSDVVGAGLLGWGTTELFLYLHQQHAQQPSRWRIFPMVAAPNEARKIAAVPTGLGVEYLW
jgi:membrane-associated phospholipid phosphatase